jgi:dolichol-phosphate mannosyltransferase
MLTKKRISVIPIAYGDEGNIVELYRRLTKVLKKITPNYEIIYICDASPDNSEAILRKLAAKDKKLTVVLHSRNFGAQNAFTTGMNLSLGDAVVLMDGDLQDPPELIEEFVKKWLTGFNVVYGVRRNREKSMGKIWQTFYHWFYLIFNKLSYIKVPLDAGDFSLMDRRTVDYINRLPEKDRFIRGLRAWVGFKQVGVEYTRPERFSGKSTNNFWRNLWWVRKAIFSFSFAPLEWIFYISIFSVLATIIAIIYYIFAYFFIADAPRGFITILVAVLFLGSIQLVTLSVICEYLRRIFEEVKSRPTAIVSEIINNHRKGKLSF